MCPDGYDNFQNTKDVPYGFVCLFVVLSAQTQTIQSLIQTMRSRGIEIRDEEGMVIVVCCLIDDDLDYDELYLTLVFKMYAMGTTVMIRCSALLPISAPFRRCFS